MNLEDIRMPLRELIDTAKERLQELQYEPATINASSRYWRELLMDNTIQPLPRDIRKKGLQKIVPSS